MGTHFLWADHPSKNVELTTRPGGIHIDLGGKTSGINLLQGWYVCKILMAKALSAKYS
jgi:hypothetical protein